VYWIQKLKNVTGDGPLCRGQCTSAFCKRQYFCTALATEPPSAAESVYATTLRHVPERKGIFSHAVTQTSKLARCCFAFLTRSHQHSARRVEQPFSVISLPRHTCLEIPDFKNKLSLNNPYSSITNISQRHVFMITPKF